MPVRLRQLYARALPHGLLDLARQLAFMFAAYTLYRWVRGYVDDPAGAAVAFENARRLISIEQGLNLFVEPQVQAWAQGVPAVVDVSSWLYINAQTTVTLGALVYLYLAHNSSFYFVRNMFAISWVLALVGYAVYPTAPPRLFPEWGFFDSVSAFTGVSHTDSVSALFNPYAAVPSMHVCFALMVGWPLSRLLRNRALKTFWAVYPLLVVFVIVTTANHFLADAVLGALTALIAFAGARGLGRLRPAAWSWKQAAIDPAPIVEPVADAVPAAVG
ncbi:MAG: phosphatase PAP2 family protein [Solirubrobacterales bacterium]|nr:phosphatase PAP2 family protein [Solirubrobacterales bacterium]